MSSSNSTPEAWDMTKFTLSVIQKDSKGAKSVVPYDANGYEFRLIADVFYNAVNAFCRPDSQKALAKLGLKVVKDWEKSEPSYKWPGDPAKMPHYVQTFTRAIKDTPPALFVDPFIEGAYASTDRFANYKGNLEEVTPWHLFRTRVGFYLVDGLKRAYYITPTNPGPYQSLRMLVIITLWHELVHGFVQYLGVEDSKHSPKNASALWNDEERATGVGESGDYMECEVWGGSVQIDRLPDPADTPTTPWGSLWIQINSRTPTWKTLTPAIIKGFTDNPYTYDLKTSTEGLKVSPVPAMFTVPIKKNVDTRMPPGSMNKLVAWNVKFKRVKGRSQFDIVKKQTTLA